MLAATEPLTPGIFTAVVVMLLVKVVVDLSGRTRPIGGRGRRALRRLGVRRRPATRRVALGPQTPWPPEGFESLATRYGRRTPRSFWHRMAADLKPLADEERRLLIAERINGLEQLAEVVAPVAPPQPPAQRDPEAGARADG